DRVRMWNTETGKSAEAVELATTGIEGVPAFSSDSKRLLLGSLMGVTEIDLKTAKKTGGWKRTELVGTIYREPSDVTILPNGKGVVSVQATGKRRQSYDVRIVTEKKDWDMGEFWDHATAPTVSPDGRWLIVSGGGRPDGRHTFILKLDEDGN